MTSILDVRRYPEAREQFRWDALWELVDGDRQRLNLAHECVDRHVGKGTALRIQFADGRREEHDDPERDERPPEDLGVRAQILEHGGLYFVPYRRSPASPSPGTM